MLKTITEIQNILEGHGRKVSRTAFWYWRKKGIIKKPDYKMKRQGGRSYFLYDLNRVFQILGLEFENE